MPKFSIIIPVYNVEKYLEKCLKSVLDQTFKDFEVIIVNDGSTDGSFGIIEKYEYLFDNIKIINQENQGLSCARNNAIKVAKGEYFLLLDSDDYIEKDLLLNLNVSTKNVPDLVRFQLKTVKQNFVTAFNEIIFNNLDGKEAFSKIVKFRFVELASIYLYNRMYYVNNNFQFEPKVYHEDFGLIPLIIIKASKVNCIDYNGYNYVQRDGSIMNNDNYDKTVEKAYDSLKQYLKIVDLDDDKIYKSFLANSVILKLAELKGQDYKKFLEKIKKYKVIDNISDDTFLKKVKKIILKINPMIYLKVIK